MPSRMAPPISVRSVPTTAWIFCTSTTGLAEDFKLASRSENKHAGSVPRLFMLERFVDVIARSFLLRGGNAVRAVEQVENIHPFEWAEPLRAGDRQHKHQKNDHANRAGGPTTPRADLDVRLPGQPHNPAQRHREQQQPIRMCELKIHSSASFFDSATGCAVDFGDGANGTLRKNFCTRWLPESAT